MNDQNNTQPAVPLYPPNDPPPSLGKMTNGQAPQSPVVSVPKEPVVDMSPAVQPRPVDANQASQPSVPQFQAPVSSVPPIPVSPPPSLTPQATPAASAVPPTPVSSSIGQPLPSPAITQPAVSPAASILTPPIQSFAAPVSTPVPAPPVAQSMTSAPFIVKKSKFPKIMLFLALGLLLLSAIGYGALQFMGKGSPLVGGGGEVTWWGVELDEQAAQAVIAEYQAQHQDVKITYVKQSPQEYRERLTNALAKGEGPDIFEIHNSWPVMFKNDLAALPSSVMSQEEFKGSFYPVMANDLISSKGVVGIPLYYDAITLYVNDDIFSSALKTPPKTWIDMQALADPARGMTQKDQEGRIIQAAVALGTTDNVDFWPEIFGLMMYQNKANFTDFTSATTKDVLTFYQSFARTSGAWDSTLPTSVQAFAKQKVAMIFAPARSADEIIQSAPTLHFKTVPLPQLPKENPTDPDFGYATYWVESVWEKSPDKEASWEFLKYASSQEALLKMNQTLKANSRPRRAYPRPGMNQEFANDPILGSLVTFGPAAKSWYLADRTNDGATGLNSQLKAAYSLALSEQGDTKTAQAEIVKILTTYGISTPK